MIFINTSVFLFLKSLLLSLLLIGLLIFNGNIERLFIIAVTLMIINVLKNTKFKSNYVFLILLGLILGYIIGNILLYYSVFTYDNNPLMGDNNNEKRLSKPAVIIFSQGEAYTFNLPIILKNIYKDESLIKKINVPIEVYKFKAAYENMGNSKYVDLSNRIKDSLMLRLGTDYDLYLAYFNISPNIDEEIDRVSKEYEKVILVPLLLSESNEYKVLKETIEQKYINSDTVIKFTPLLWKSQKLSKQILEKLIEKVGKDNIDSTGVIFLISNNEKYYEQSIFCNEITRRMQKSKFQKDKIISLKYDNNEKLLLKSIKNLKEKGVDNIIITSVSSLQQDIKEQDKMNKLINKTEKKEFIDMHYINGWGIGENLLNELEYKIRITNLKN